MNSEPRRYADYAPSSRAAGGTKRADPLDALNVRLRKAGRADHVAAVAAHVDTSTGDADSYALQALTLLTEAQQEELVALIRPASFTIDMRRLVYPPR
jgi:hypothetical protein